MRVHICAYCHLYNTEDWFERKGWKLRTQRQRYSILTFCPGSYTSQAAMQQVTSQILIYECVSVRWVAQVLTLDSRMLLCRGVDATEQLSSLWSKFTVSTAASCSSWHVLRQKSTVNRQRRHTLSVDKSLQEWSETRLKYQNHHIYADVCKQLFIQYILSRVTSSVCSVFHWNHQNITLAEY